MPAWWEAYTKALQANGKRGKGGFMCGYVWGGVLVYGSEQSAGHSCEGGTAGRHSVALGWVVLSRGCGRREGIRNFTRRRARLIDSIHFESNATYQQRRQGSQTCGPPFPFPLPPGGLAPPPTPTPPTPPPLLL